MGWRETHYSDIDPAGDITGVLWVGTDEDGTDETGRRIINFTGGPEEASGYWILNSDCDYTVTIYDVYMDTDTIGSPAFESSNFDMYGAYRMWSADDYLCFVVTGSPSTNGWYILDRIPCISETSSGYSGYWEDAGNSGYWYSGAWYGNGFFGPSNTGEPYGYYPPRGTNRFDFSGQSAPGYYSGDRAKFVSIGLTGWYSSGGTFTGEYKPAEWEIEYLGSGEINIPDITYTEGDSKYVGRRSGYTLSGTEWISGSGATGEYYTGEETTTVDVAQIGLWL